MRAVDPKLPLFCSRLDAGEELYFKSPLGRPEPARTVLIAASDGAVEVSWPWSYLCALDLRRVDPGQLPATLDDLDGAHVAVVDDGLLARDAIDRIVRSARRSGAAQVVLVAPAVRTSVRRTSRRAGVDRIVTLRPSTHADAVSRLYPQRAARPGVAAMLLAEARQAWQRDRLERVPEALGGALPDSVVAASASGHDSTGQRADRPPLHLVAK